MNFYYFFIPFLLTNVVEYSLASLIRRKELLRLVGFVLLINLFTWPLAVIANNALFVNFYIVEAAVMAAENLLYKCLLGLTWKNAFAIAFIINFVTAAMSFVF